MYKCFSYKKCSLCNKRNEDIYTIKTYCKYYNKNICEYCYNKKLKGTIK